MGTTEKRKVRENPKRIIHYRVLPSGRVLTTRGWLPPGIRFSPEVWGREKQRFEGEGIRCVENDPERRR